MVDVIAHLAWSIFRIVGAVGIQVVEQRSRKQNSTEQQTPEPPEPKNLGVLRYVDTTCIVRERGPRPARKTWANGRPTGWLILLWIKKW